MHVPPHLPTDPVGPAPATHDPDVPDSGNAPLAPMTPADELLDKIKQLEGEVESMKKAFGVHETKVDDVTSFYDTEFKVLKGKVAALEIALAQK